MELAPARAEERRRGGLPAYMREARDRERGKERAARKRARGGEEVELQLAVWRDVQRRGRVCELRARLSGVRG